MENMAIRSMTELGNFEGYIENKDYVGALAILDFGKLENLNPVDKLQWRGYCYSRLGGRTNYNRAREAYLELLSGNFDGYDIPEVTRLFLAIVYVQLGQYADAEEMAFLFDQDSELKSRILLHLAQKTKDETKLAKHRLALSSSKEDILSAAAVEFAFRHRYQEAVDVYRSILIAGNVDDIALYVYTAMALFNMGRHEQSLEALSIYCQTQPNSLFAANLKACNMFHLYNGQVALDVLDALCDGKAKDKHDLLRHNTVVFNNGEKALQFLPGLVDCVPEARLNLAIYYIKQGEIDAAVDLIGDMDADSPQSHFVLGILNVERDQTMGDAKALTTACNHFQSMGEASTECDTVAGRQCMAMYFYLMKQFENSNVFLDSIKEHSEDADDFNWNYGISLAASGKFKEGLETLLKVSKEMSSELACVAWIVKCYIATNSPQEAWDCYLQIEDSNIANDVLRFIGNECYKIGGGMYLFSARSFAELLKTDDCSNTDHDGLIGACVGYFRHTIHNKHKADSDLMDVVDMLETSSVPKCQQVAEGIRKFLQG